MKKYDAAPEYEERLGGKMAHIVVIENVTREILDEFIKDLNEEELPGSSSLIKEDAKVKIPKDRH
jgi:hypothetical protein